MRTIEEVDGEFITTARSIGLVEAGFELNYMTGAISSPYLDICFGAAAVSACSAAGGADFTFSVDSFGGGSISAVSGKGILEKTSVSGDLLDSAGSPIESISGFINGISTDNTEGERAFVLGFNLATATTAKRLSEAHC